MTVPPTSTGPTEWPQLPEPYSVEEMLEIIAESTKLDRKVLTPDATMVSLNIASLDMVDLLFAMEEKFNVYVPMGDELSNVVYLADLIDLLANLIQDSGQAQASAN